MSEHKDKFGSHIGSLLALAGSAVGLGNIWRFPYMLGEYGAGAFIPVYLLCILLISMPIMLAELIMGRRSQTSAYGSLRRLGGGKGWIAFGVLFVLIPSITVSYYSVIGGWTLDYFFKSLAFEFSNAGSPDVINSMFSTMVSNTWVPVLFHFAFLLITAVIVTLGVKKGIEGFSKIMMPMLFIMMIFIAVRSLTLPGAGQGVRELFHFSFSDLSSELFIAALGQSFYSLSIGMGIMLTYGSYLSRKQNLNKTAYSTIIFDFLFAMIAGLAVIPAMYSFGMESTQGPGLVYQTLPLVFSQMPAGGIIAIVFFFSVLLAALTSAISLFEVPVAFLVQRMHWSRPVASLVTFACTFTLGAFCSLSFGPLAGVDLLGNNIFDFCDGLCANFLMPFAGLAPVIFLGWKMKKEDVYDEFTSGGHAKDPKLFFKFVYISIKYIAPIAIILIFVSGLL